MKGADLLVSALENEGVKQILEYSDRCACRLFGENASPRGRIAFESGQFGRILPV